MKLNLENLPLNIIEALTDLGNEKNMRILKGKEVRNLLRTIKILKDTFTEFEQVQNKIVESYGERDKEGNLISLAPGQISIKKEFVKEVQIKIDEAKKIEIEVPMGSMTYNSFEKRGFKMKNIELLSSLYNLFIIEEEEKKEEEKEEIKEGEGDGKE